QTGQRQHRIVHGGCGSPEIARIGFDNQILRKISRLGYSRQPAMHNMGYAWPRDDGTVGSDREPVALFTGEAVHAYLGHLSDAAIEAMLNELATELGAALGQERIYVAFAERTWILDAGEHRG